jgi:hypothetical protein
MKTLQTEGAIMTSENLIESDHICQVGTVLVIPCNNVKRFKTAGFSSMEDLPPSAARQIPHPLQALSVSTIRARNKELLAMEALA